MDEQVQELKGNFSDVLAVTELRGSYPNVPIFADVDYAALVAGDDNPTFLTLPIGKVNAISGNKRYYDAAFVQELERQTLTNKPVGLMGHLSDTERSTSFPPEAVHWVGAMRDGDTLWGKAYVVPGAVRERIARYKNTGRAIATSIDAFAEGKWDENLKAYRMSASSLRLNQIDIAPADRAGIPDLAAVPILTKEMDGEPGEENQEPEVDKLQIINEMTAEDARLLPDVVRQAITATVQPPAEVAIVQELRTALGVDGQADLGKLIAEMSRVQETQRKAAILTRITELAAPDSANGIKVDSVRGIVTELVNARNPQSIEAADAAYGQVLEMQSVKDALASAVQSKMGPPQRVPVAGQQVKAHYFNIPQEA